MQPSHDRRLVDSQYPHVPQRLDGRPYHSRILDAFAEDGQAAANEYVGYLYRQCSLP